MEYLKDLNGLKAAIRAGYSPKGAGVQAFHLLNNPKIAAEIQKRMDARAARVEIDADKVLQEIGRLAFCNIHDYIRITPEGEAAVDLSKLTRDQAAAIQEVTVDQYAGGAGDGERAQVKRTRFKLADKGLNLERLGRHLKLFTDKVEATGKDGEPLQTTVVVNFVRPDGESAG